MKDDMEFLRGIEKLLADVKGPFTTSNAIAVLFARQMAMNLKLSFAIHRVARGEPMSDEQLAELLGVVRDQINDMAEYLKAIEGRTS